jgi:putative hemolysin
MNTPRDITYATGIASKPAQTIIRTLELLTGRRSLLRRAAGYDRDLAAGRSFWEVMPERYGLSLDVVGGNLNDIPANGPLILISNHPYGILDGLMMGHILDRLRPDFRILANAVFKRAEVLDRVLLPVDFSETREAVALNLQTRARALDYLGQGGAIGIFPGGTVSTAQKPLGRPMDPVWRNFTAKMIAKSGATVVPIFFPGHNSRLFQVASHLHYSLRLGLLLKEFRARLDQPVPVVVGQPLDAAEIAARKGDPTALMEWLRRSTYDLSPGPRKSYALGYEFEAKYRNP